MFNTYTYHHLPPTSFVVCYTIFRETQHCKQHIIFEQQLQWSPWRWRNKHRNMQKLIGEKNMYLMYYVHLVGVKRSDWLQEWTEWSASKNIICSFYFVWFVFCLVIKRENKKENNACVQTEINPSLLKERFPVRVFPLKPCSLNVSKPLCYHGNSPQRETLDSPFALTRGRQN